MCSTTVCPRCVWPSALPTQVDVTVTVGSRVVTCSWAGSDWGAPGKTRRRVVPVDSLPAGVHAFTIEARRILGGVSDLAGSASGRLVVVDRSASPFGAGWWLAGLERLTALSATELLWVGGDGSTRVYLKRGGGPCMAGKCSACLSVRPRVCEDGCGENPLYGGISIYL